SVAILRIQPDDGVEIRDRIGISLLIVVEIAAIVVGVLVAGVLADRLVVVSQRGVVLAELFLHQTAIAERDGELPVHRDRLIVILQRVVVAAEPVVGIAAIVEVDGIGAHRQGAIEIVQAVRIHFLAVVGAAAIAIRVGVVGLQTDRLGVILDGAGKVPLAVV